MELHQVRYFVALAHSLNFTRAAEQCKVTQSALTKAVLKLERELGGSLIHRERQFTQLTDLGKLILPMLERTLAAAEAVRVSADEFNQRSISPLKIALTPSVSAALVAGALSEIARRMPGLQIEIVGAQSDRLPSLLSSGQVGAAVIGEDLNESPRSVERWPLFEERIHVIAAIGDPLAAEATISIDQLADAVWIESIGCELTHKFWRMRFPAGRPSRIGHRGRQLQHLQHMVAAGLGIMLMPEHIPLIAGIVKRPISGDPLRRMVELLVSTDQPVSPGLEAFVRVARVFEWSAEAGFQKGYRLNGPRRQDRKV